MLLNKLVIGNSDQTMACFYETQLKKSWDAISDLPVTLMAIAPNMLTSLSDAVPDIIEVEYKREKNPLNSSISKSIVKL